MKAFMQKSISMAFKKLSQVSLQISTSWALSCLWEVSRNQFKSSRASKLRDLIDMYEKPISVLEIGTWYGLGSTQVFKRYLPDGSSLLMLDKWSSYASEEDIKSERSWYRQMDAQSKEALLSVLEITNKSKDENQNIQKNGGGVNFSIIRSDATIFTNFLKSSIFDLVFIDGSHYYENVKSDIQAAKRLVKKDFSIICGDDLELKPNASNIAIAKEYIRHDSHPDGFHPGVLLAVSEEFEKVNIYEGFWFVYCIDGQFKTEK